MNILKKKVPVFLVAMFFSFAMTSQAKASMREIDQELHIAVRSNNLDDVRELVKYKGADVNTADHYGFPPLLEAVKNNNLALVTFLLENGAYVNIIDEEKAQVPLTLAKDLAMAVLLVENGANVNNPVRPPLIQMVVGHYADRLERAQYFLKKGANVNIQYIGVTPLMTAVREGDVVFVKLFLSYDADPFIKDKEGKMAIDHVQEGFKKYGPEKVAQYKEIIRLLAVAMKDPALQKKHEEMIEKQLGWFYKLKRRLQSFFRRKRSKRVTVLSDKGCS